MKLSSKGSFQQVFKRIFAAKGDGGYPPIPLSFFWHNDFPLRGGRGWPAIPLRKKCALFAPWHVFAYNRANTCTSVLKTLDFSQIWVWKRAVSFLLHKVISFCPKNKVNQKYHNFIRGDPYKLSQMPLDQRKISKAKHYFGGFSVSKLHESFWIRSIIHC